MDGKTNTHASHDSHTPLQGKEDMRDPYEPPPTPSDDVPIASLHHVRRAREVEEGTAHTPTTSVLSASSGAVSNLTSPLEERSGYEPTVEDDIAFTDYYNGMQDDGGQQQQEATGYEYGVNTPSPPSGVALPLTYKQYVDGPFTSAQMVKTLDSIEPNMHPLQLQQVFVHPQDPLMRETGCVSVRKAAAATSEPLVTSAPLRRQFVLQAVSFVHRPNTIEEVQMERYVERQRARAEADEPTQLLRDMLKRKQTEPAHFDEGYDPRYETRISLGHLLGALRNAGTKPNNVIPVHAFEPETQEAFDVTPTNALIMSAGPHVALRALQVWQ